MYKILFILLMITSFCCSQVVGPKISTQQTQFDFGKISAKEKVFHDFYVMNNGGDSLVIRDVRASCGCTVAKPEKSVLTPGETTKITVSFDPSGRRGHQQKYVYVSSNDKNSPELRFSFAADIEEENLAGKGAGPKIQLDFASHDFGEIPEGKIVDWTVNFKNVGQNVLEIQDVRTSCGCTAAVVSGKSIKPGESGSLKIEFDSTNKSGKISKTVSILSNDQENPDQTIVITANIKNK